MMKTSVMATGEFDYGDIFNDGKVRPEVCSMSQNCKSFCWGTQNHFMLSIA